MIVMDRQNDQRERERERASRWRARKKERASRWRATELRGVTAVIASTLRRKSQTIPILNPADTMWAEFSTGANFVSAARTTVCGDLVLVHSLPRAIGISVGGVCLLDT